MNNSFSFFCIIDPFGPSEKKVLVLDNNDISQYYAKKKNKLELRIC